MRRNVVDRFPFLIQNEEPELNVPVLVDSIAATQQADGRIPWSPGDKTDPWDHVESAMGLTVGGAYAAARRAFEWLKQKQLPDGGWYAAYDTDTVRDRTCETNHAAYVAAGLYHHFLATGDIGLMRDYWPTLEAAIEFVLRHQAPSGEIWWAVSPIGQVDHMALLTGNSSIYFSLKCALALSELLEKPRPHWHSALGRLKQCLSQRPHCFNMTKSRFAMDWFYPALCGALTPAHSWDRISRQWKKFVIQNRGVRCVSDQPWVTIAESSELVLTLAAMGNHLLARIVFGWIGDHAFEDGTFWCGFTCPDMVVWPAEKITWTNAAVLLAADAIYGLTPAARLFDHRFWHDKGW
jgi:hypothetical protein